ncbi:MAG: D-alanyl-D-alanine dipeptidase [Rhodospirillaceae bacterium]|jgi:zinc D-Ala-D-Ala dipeptidase|nr:D-alanyl-D-alanine dipeptidase [Rhodospirillaceae bacterium]MBT5241737.1 D-alanyl-D-alanine dipeptidase [Rhodospirillaceae bacterium]MBT5566528.1 D-alanyl-D-alanine dipeptidase [Rhodospirillaceae bacterium]MBT6089646.1 D-alanyl-D-alanine dipeptidase [Rhodospirillaceae bacterium]MBT6960837.1 D-alanyl-D-alanine dipeptidase [Rhodospirillaceae bacterium]
MLVEIASPEFDVDFDIAYATPNNFTGKPVYARPGCYLHADAADLLQRAISLARPLGLRLKVFDAFRPSEAQWVLWEHTPDSDFLAHPERGSPHSMGAAVDLTLLDANDAELDMGTGFDDFTPRAFHGDLDISPDAQRNRIILMGIMTSAGWDFFRNEWWHYQLFSPRDRYPVLSDGDLPTPMMS